MPLFPALLRCGLSHAILAAGNFSDYELTFLSTEVQQKVVKRLLRMASSNSANTMQATHTRPAQVIPFGLSIPRGHCGGMQLLQVQPQMCYLQLTDPLVRSPP